jgi:hypothetical protein
MDKCYACTMMQFLLIALKTTMLNKQPLERSRTRGGGENKTKQGKETMVTCQNTYGPTQNNEEGFVIKRNYLSRNANKR